MPRNGLTRDALTAGGPVLNAIKSHSLDRDTFLDPSLGDLSTPMRDDQRVRSLLEYITSCALDPDTTVHTGIMGTDGAEIAWAGEVGLCGRNSPLGDWHLGAPSRDCLEIVSSCVLARVNALHKKVVISARGSSSCLLPLQPKVRVEEEYRECGGTPIQSFHRCAASDAALDPAERDCGWTGRFVGSCTPGSKVTLQANAGTVLRVCRGIYGCDHRDWAPPAESDRCPTSPESRGYPEPETPWYAGVIGSYHTDSYLPVTFDCPGNDLPSGAPSYFSVMMAPRSPDPDSALADDADVSIVGPQGKYPAPEEEVFTFREGAFFGDIFDGDQHACYSDLWTQGDAYLNDRFCVAPDSDCFNHKPLPCLWELGNPGTEASVHSCSQESCGAEQSYLGCRGNASETGSGDRSASSDHAITVFLNHPCDLTANCAAAGSSDLSNHVP